VGPTHQRGERREGRTGLAQAVAGPRVVSVTGPKWLPRAFFSFSFLFDFLFLVFELFPNFCKNASNHFKQNPKFF
jgi:hypothetical protein